MDIAAALPIKADEEMELSEAPPNAAAESAAAALAACIPLPLVCVGVVGTVERVGELGGESESLWGRVGVRSALGDARGAEGTGVEEKYWQLTWSGSLAYE